MVRGEHAREEGVWKHWLEPEQEPEKMPDAHEKMVPKDGSSKANIYHMQYTSNKDAFGWDMILSMLKIGSHEKFTLVISVSVEDVKELKAKIAEDVSKNAAVKFKVLSVKVKSDNFSEWAEDSGEFLKDRTIGVPRYQSSSQIEDTMKAGREAREVPSPKQQWENAVMGTQENPASIVGDQVNKKGKHIEKHGIAKKSGKKLINFASYFEGGNLLAGTDLNGIPYALVGKDVITASCHLLGKKYDKSSEAMVKNLLVKDIGVAFDNILFVEQPGRFHLDMGMVLLGKGTVLLNDSNLVFKVMESWLTQDSWFVMSKLEQLGMTEDEVKDMFVKVKNYLIGILKEQAMYEDLACQNLGEWNDRLSIKRIPASFPETIFNPAINFLNGETGTGPDERSFFITNGGDARTEDFISDCYYRLLKGSQLARIYFVNSNASSESLGKGGGIGCRTKTECLA